MTTTFENDLLKENSYFIIPFRKSFDLVLQKKTTDNLFQKILQILLNYFKNIKQHRTIQDVNDAIEKVKELLEAMNIKDLTEEEFQEEMKSFKQYLENFLENNLIKIENALINAKFGYLVRAWIYALNELFITFNNVFRMYKRKIRRLHRSSGRIHKTLDQKMENFFKAAFLVLFRIIEQIFLITKGDHFVPEDEIDLLLEDVVYLDNVYRSLSDVLH